MVNIPEQKIDGRIFVKNVQWADPDESSFKEQVRDIYKNYKSAKESSKTLQKKILSNYNKTEITKLYQKVLFE